MTEKELTVIELTEESIESMVYEIGGQKVMIDFDLARIYGYTTKAFNQQVKNNIEKFPEDFMFRLTPNEIKQISRSQIATAQKGVIEPEDFVRSKKLTARIWNTTNKGGRTSFPYAFTEQGMKNVKTDVLTTLFKNQYYDKRIEGIKNNKFPELILRYEKRSGWALIATDSSSNNVSNVNGDVK